MFSIKWCKEGNYPLLSGKVADDLKVNPPRPVFHEELDLFGFFNHWEYPKSESPLLWACGRSYYYKGVEVARVTGGGLGVEPTLEVIHKGKLKPIDIDNMVEANKARLITLENEAKFFIRDVEKKRKQNEQMTVSYSGGKDSQVVLELVSQVLVPSDYVVIYTNTGMELQNNPQIVNEALMQYRAKFPELQYMVAQANNDIVENWRTFGPPSRMHRWCCSVAKSIPFYVELLKVSDKSSFIVFEGVRREESNARRNYERIASQVKHSMVKNVRPIIEWNDTEVYLYLFYRECTLNPLYRKGLTRVGCSICPYSSDWSEYIISKLHPHINDKFIEVISESFQYNGISDPKKRAKYIKDGKWKVRSGERILSDLGSSIRMTNTNEGYVLKIHNPKTSIKEWLKVFDYHMSVRDSSSFDLVIKKNNKAAIYWVHMAKDSVDVHFKSENSLEIDQELKKMLNKVTFCSSCLGCMIECPTGAISFEPSLKIDQNLCIKCHNCLHAFDKGCLVAASRSITLLGDTMKKQTNNPDRYSTFGLREGWLKAHLTSDAEWISTLGSKQIPAVKKWLRESELMSLKDEKTILAELLASMSFDDVWGIVWHNLCYNSEIVRWYHNVDYKHWDRKELQTLLICDYEQYAEGTVTNPFVALLNTLDSSMVLSDEYGQGLLTKKGKSVTHILKRGKQDLPNTVLIYAIYKYSEHIKSNSLTLEQLFDVDKEFTLKKVYGVDRKSIEKQLISLQEHRSKLVRVEFVANLDNIFLNKDLSATEALQIYLEGK